jgi:hypothetical protein
MKSWLSLIFAVLISWLPLGLAQAANLKYVRAGEHGSFTRVVFEFQGMVQSTEPDIIGIGKFSVIFSDMTTALPRKTLNKTTKGIQSVELIQKESRLTATTTLSFPYFKLKTFSLSNPDRLVIDVYKMSSPPTTSHLEESLKVKPINIKPDTEEPLQAKADTKKNLQANPNKVVLIEPADVSQMIQTKKFSKNTNYSVLIYIFALLNVLSLIIIALLSLNLLRRRSTTGSESLKRVLGSLETTDERIADINVLIKKELEKLHQL